MHETFFSWFSKFSMISRAWGTLHKILGRRRSIKIVIFIRACWWSFKAAALNPLYTIGFFLLVWYNILGKVHCTYLGMSGYNLKKKCILFPEDLFYLYKQCRPWCSIMLHFIWVFTVCKSTSLGVSRIQAVETFFFKQNMCLLVLMLCIPVNNFIVMLRRFPVILGWTSNKHRLKCLAPGHQEVTLMIKQMWQTESWTNKKQHVLAFSGSYESKNKLICSPCGPWDNGSTIKAPLCRFDLLVLIDLILYVPVNDFFSSVGKGLPGLNQY